MEQSTSAGRTNEIIAKKAGVGKTNVAYLLAVYRNRLDLFYRVRDGEIAIGRAYQQMKDDEKPRTYWHGRGGEQTYHQMVKGWTVIKN